MANQIVTAVLKPGLAALSIWAVGQAHHSPLHASYPSIEPRRE